jgi:uncharacterized DUF497 family protein
VLHFEWDPDRAASNEAKHGVAFSEAATAFGDPLSLTIADRDHSEGEARFILLRVTYLGRLVVVAHAESDDHIRIISARPATNAERRSYEQED